MIPMNCPKCGARGEIPLDKLDTRLHCRKCGTYFYMDATGHVYVGDPADKVKKTARPRAAERASVDIELNPLKLFEGMSKAAKIGVAAVLGIVLLGFGAATAVKALQKPEDLADRAQHLSDPFLDMQPSVLAEYGLPGPNSKEAMEAWYNRVRSALPLKEPRKMPQDAIASSMIIGQAKDYADTTTSVTLAPGVAAPPSGSATPTTGPTIFSYPLTWRLKDGKWLVDFKSSLMGFEMSEKAKARAAAVAKARAQYAK